MRYSPSARLRTMDLRSGEIDTTDGLPLNRSYEFEQTSTTQTISPAVRITNEEGKRIV